MAEHGVISAWGGDSRFVEISAKFGANIEKLLETVLLVAERIERHYKLIQQFVPMF